MADEGPAESGPAPTAHAPASTTAVPTNPTHDELRRRESASTIHVREGELHQSKSHHNDRNGSIPFKRIPTSLDMQQYFVSFPARLLFVFD